MCENQRYGGKLNMVSISIHSSWSLAYLQGSLSATVQRREYEEG